MSSTFEWVMAAICIVCAVLLISGNGDGLMKIFGGENDPRRSMTVQKKRSKEEEKRYQKVLGVFCVILAACEIVLALFGSASRAVPIVTIAITILALVGMVQYLRRKF